MKLRREFGGLAVGRSVCRVFRVKPDYDKPHIVEVRVARTRRHMHAEIARLDGRKTRTEPECMGLVRRWSSRVDARSVVRPGRVVARMYLNAADLRARPGEIIAHECTHAGMAWAKLRKANLKKMVGEEVLCYAVGVMTAQINSIGHRLGIWL